MNVCISLTIRMSMHIKPVIIFAQQPSILKKWNTHNIRLGNAARAWEVSQTLCLISFKHADQDFWLPSSDTLLFRSCNTWMWWYTINEKWRYKGPPETTMYGLPLIRAKSEYEQDHHMWPTPMRTPIWLLLWCILVKGKSNTIVILLFHLHQLKSQTLVDENATEIMHQQQWPQSSVNPFVVHKEPKHEVTQVLVSQWLCLFVVRPILQSIMRNKGRVTESLKLLGWSLPWQPETHTIPARWLTLTLRS